MDTTPWILIAVLVLIIALGVAAVLMKKKTKAPTDYYIFFIMGIIWLGAGIPLKNYALSAMGVVFMIIGLANKDKWKANHRRWSQLGPEEKRLKLFLIIGLGVLVLAGLAAYFLVERGII